IFRFGAEILREARSRQGVIGWSEIQNARPQTAPSLGKLQGAPLEDFQQLFIPLWRDVLFEAARGKWLFGFRFDFRERYGAVPVIFIGKYLPGFRVRDSDALLGIHSECLHRREFPTAKRPFQAF